MPKVVDIPSSLFNVINFILFDIVLASLVFYITADIAGLVNSASALHQLGNRLYANNPPLVGVGLTCTRRGVFRALALVRAGAMVLVLATNFLIEGASRDLPMEGRARVVVLGAIDPGVKQVEVRQLTLRRRGCQARTPTSVYYGELRVDGACELRRKYFSPETETVEYGLTFEQKRVPLANCKLTPSVDTEQYVCDNGVVACLLTSARNETKSDSCRGTVLLPDAGGTPATHLCEGTAVDPNGPGGTARCRLARGARYNLTTWVPFISTKARTLRDIFDALHAAGEREQMVWNVRENAVEVSEVDWAWFYILGVKGLAIAVLVVIDLVLRSKGFVRVANDEFGIGSLLRQSAVNANAGWGEAVGVDEGPGGAGAGDVEEGAAGEGAAGEGAARDGRRAPARGSRAEPALLVQNEGGVLRARTSFGS